MPMMPMPMRFYRKSIKHLAKTPLRVELARSHLLYGEWLRRRGCRGDARDQLAIAHDALNEMGIGAFAERARRELSAATGRRTRRYLDAPSARLTSQELQIAELVQRGLSNREIGGRLFLEPSYCRVAFAEHLREGRRVLPSTAERQEPAPVPSF